MSDLFHFFNHPSLSITVLSVIICDSGFVFPWICDRKNIYHRRLTSEVLFCGKNVYYLFQYSIQSAAANSVYSVLPW